MSSPATIRDLYDILLTSKGKAPRELFEAQKDTLSLGAKKHWENETKSTQEAISWWTG